MTIRKIYGTEVKVNENGKVIGAYTTEGNLLHIYKHCKTGGWDKCDGEYTVDELRKKIHAETAIYR